MVVHHLGQNKSHVVTKTKHHSENADTEQGNGFRNYVQIWTLDHHTRVQDYPTRILDYPTRILDYLLRL